MLGVLEIAGRGSGFLRRREAGISDEFQERDFGLRAGEARFVLGVQHRT